MERHIQPDRLRNAQRDVQLHRRLTTLQLADDSAVDTDHVSERALAQPKVLSSVTNALPKGFCGGGTHDTER